jgi:transcriptional regulator with XRE-family HTH domain
MTPRKLHQILKDLRENTGITLEDWAWRIGYSPNHVQKVERGIRQPSPEMLNSYGNLARLIQWSDD